MDPESVSASQEYQSGFYKTTLCLAYQSFGVIYGDLSTSPIYVYKSIFSGNFGLYEEDHEILGVLSLVFWTLTIIPLCKYIIFVLDADDKGEGGTFAVYSLLCRHGKMGLLCNYPSAYESNQSSDSETSSAETRSSMLIKKFFEKHQSSRVVLFLVVLLGTSMVISDGVLTPSMSVLSAVHGIKIKVEDLHENCTVMAACIVLVAVFALQQFGTHRVGFLFAPILTAWLLCLGGIGIYNVIHWNPRVLHAISPHYIYNFFKADGKNGWRSLGGVVLCVTGAEAMFADLGHFSKLSIRIAFTAVVYPCLVLAYMGEAAYLSKNKMDLKASFYKAIPECIFWPVFLIATLATVVGSQAIISATFSIISQCRALRCFPRVKIIHTSNEIHGQIYIPEINWILMVLCLAVVIGFKSTTSIGNAHGLAAIMVMFVTTCLMFLIITSVWKKNVVAALSFVLAFGAVELLYLSASLAKVPQGGWFPLAFSLVVLSLMSIWHYVTLRKNDFELQNKVSVDSLLDICPDVGITRVPGISFIYSNIGAGVPPMFAHFVTNFPAIHEIVIFVTFQHLMVPKVPLSEQFVVSRIGYPDFSLFRCIVRYGYRDVRDTYHFENELIEKVAEFLKHECRHQQSPFSVTNANRRVSFRIGGTETATPAEIAELMTAKESGVAYMISNNHVVATETSSMIKKLMINVVYGFLRRNCRQPATALGIPHTSSIEVGMLYHV